MIISEKTYQKILEHLGEGISIIHSEYLLTNNSDAEDGLAMRKMPIIAYWNSAAESLSGYEISDMLGKSCRNDFSLFVDENGDNLCEKICPFTNKINPGQVREVKKVFLHHKDGYRKPVSLTIIPILDDKKELTAVIEIIRETMPSDVVEQMSDYLSQLAMFDPVTEMPNKKFIERDIRARLAEVNRYNRQFGILFIGIDDFKSITKKHGKSMSERLLRVVAMTIHNTIRPFDIAGRWKGENFAVLVLNVAEEQLKIVANRIKTMVSKSSITTGQNIITAEISIGGTIAHKGDKIESLVNRAVKFLHRARASEENRIVIASTSDEELENINRNEILSNIPWEFPDE